MACRYQKVGDRKGFKNKPRCRDGLPSTFQLLYLFNHTLILQFFQVELTEPCTAVILQLVTPNFGFPDNLIFWSSRQTSNKLKYSKVQRFNITHSPRKSKTIRTDSIPWNCSWSTSQYFKNNAFFFFFGSADHEKNHGFLGIAGDESRVFFPRKKGVGFSELGSDCQGFSHEKKIPTKDQGRIPAPTTHR